ncbi:hypothetical protein HYH03_016362 [Edaphochlamys debaryana]|uniref:Ran-binding protein 10 n=1 Tax=Edaphochlamys debaryana TaxID=47281 RepID=A0A835XIV1_9CHLO|nr:hypothetical protein HYH03_016362 [Edaphochlamys debaryana]|eukprot:KAG2484878.1 hypothetical protein HYH03_016362 [Edaphochlamys debaryana]
MQTETGAVAQPWPSELNSARQGHGLELKDKLTVRYASDGRHNNDVGAIQANHSVPSNCTVYYYEVTILDQGIAGKIAVGFADKNFKLTRQPGWEVGSYGYHGDDGKKFCGSGMGEEYGPTFGAGDTVGAGIHLGRQELFFTKNGTKLKLAHRPVRAGLYPTVGLHSKGEMVQVNFGAKPWVFDLEGMLAEERAVQRAAVQRIPVSSGTSHQLVRQYLLHYGYEDTLRAFDEAAGLGGEGASSSAPAPASSDAASLLPLRSGLRRCLLAGDVDGALELLRGGCPALLGDAGGRFGDVHFALACQQYIELVRAGQIEEAVRFAQGTLAPLRGSSGAGLEGRLRDVVALVAYPQPEASPLAHLLRGRGVEMEVEEGQGKGEEGVGKRRREEEEEEGEGGGRGELGLRPALSVPAAAAAARPCSRVEALLSQLVAVQGTLHEANGGQGGVFDLREAMLGPGA